MNKKIKKCQKMSTYEKFIQDPIEKEKFEKEYNKFLLSEFLLEAMEENHISVRKLAEKSGISPSIIQNIRSEKTSNVTFNIGVMSANVEPFEGAFIVMFGPVRSARKLYTPVVLHLP